MENHDIVDISEFKGIRYELRTAKTTSGEPAEGLHNAWIWLDNPTQYNSYTTDMVKSVILAVRKASNDRSVNAIVFTAVGDKAFCTGGNTKEYAEYYAGNPPEYRQYMRLFNDMVTALLIADKPVVCRVNGMRIGGGQEIGMACDYSVAQDLARFGQAGPKHGSAPDGGSTDFLPLFVGMENAMVGCTLCEPWSAHQAYRFGVVHELTPALRVDGKLVANPTVVTDRWVNEYGRIVFGEPKGGDELAAGKALLKQGAVDLAPLDEAVERLCGKLLMTFPGCTMKTIGSLRKFKLEHWQRNSETNREWLGLNMMTEGKAGFQAFNDGPKGNREIDFVALRRLLAEGRPWTDELVRAVSPQYAK